VLQQCQRALVQACVEVASPLVLNALAVLHGWQALIACYQPGWLPELAKMNASWSMHPSTCRASVVVGLFQQIWEVSSAMQFGVSRVLWV
jgi:hypothetical protein